MYYETLDALIRKYERTPKQYAFGAKTREEHQAWKERARARLWEITGLEDCEAAEPAPQLIQVCEMEGFQRESWLITTEPDIQMPFYLLRPETANGAAVLFLHGHGGGKEMLVTGPGEDGPTFAEELAREGFLVFCPDERGSGQRRERFEQGDSRENCRGNSHRELQQAAIGFGQSMIGWAMWDLMRLVDYIETLPEVEKGRIGCAGFSGGGQLALWLAALDERIIAAMTGGYFYGMKDALVEMCNNCACNYVPFMWKTMDMGDLGALVAPRALFIESGAADPLSGKRGLENVYEQVEITQKAYMLYGAKERLEHRVHPDGHVWSGAGVKEFFKEFLGNYQHKDINSGLIVKQ